MSKRTAAVPRRSPRPARPAAAGNHRAVRWVPALVSFVLSGLLFGFVGYQVGKPSDFEQRVQDLQQAEDARDARQVAEVTDLAEKTRDQLVPVLDQMATALPPAGAGTPATPDTVAGWQRVVDAAAAAFANPPSGGTDVNVTRQSLSAAIFELQAAVRTYSLSLTAPADTAGRLRDLAGQQRNGALSTWAVGGTVIDKMNHAANRGHHHVFLSPDPNSSQYGPTSGAPK